MAKVTEKKIPVLLNDVKVGGKYLYSYNGVNFTNCVVTEKNPIDKTNFKLSGVTSRKFWTFHDPDRGINFTTLYYR